MTRGTRVGLGLITIDMIDTSMRRIVIDNNGDQYGCGGYIKHDDHNNDIVHQDGDHEGDIVIPTMFKTMALMKKMVALIKKMTMINETMVMTMIHETMVMTMIKKLATSGRPAGSN